MGELLNLVFDENGNFMGNFYKDKIRELIFEDDGNVRYEICDELITYLDNHPELRYNCDAVRLYYSISIDYITNGNYSSDVMWRNQNQGAYSAGYEFIRNNGYKTLITEKFFLENGFKLEDKEKLLIQSDDFYGESYIDKTIKYIISATNIKVMDKLWHIHIDNEDRDSVGSICISCQEDFIKFVKLCGIKKELKLVK